MQTVSADFTTRTAAPLRRISYRALISFRKAFDENVDFFTIGTSTIGGTDILKGLGSVVQEWDKYDYEDYSDRVKSIEVNREVTPPTNPISLATADIVLDNHDDIFTPGNSASPLDGYILSRRPIRINTGFSGETIPKFVGVTVGKPDIDDREKTATFHCIDFLNAIMNISLDDEVIYLNKRTDEIIQAVLEAAGLTASQFDLDEGSVIIPFTWFKKGMKVGQALRDVAEAELGNIRMTEAGVIVFENRQKWNTFTPSYVFNRADNLLELQSMGVDTIINAVEVYSRARAVGALQSVWEASMPTSFSDNTVTIKPGETKTIFADVKDDFGDLPVTTVNDPEPIDTATSSLYEANSEPDGSGTDLTADIDLDSTDLFSTTFKMTFTNNGSTEAYITQINLFGTPAKVVADIYKRVVSASSVGDRDAFEEHPYKVENDLIQDESAANSIAQIIVSDRGSDDNQQRWMVKAVPQLQIGDAVSREDTDVNEDYFVTRVNDIINPSGYRQILRVSKRTINTYFRIGISTIGGTDAIGP
jgi:hypothetical protein